MIVAFIHREPAQISPFGEHCRVTYIIEVDGQQIGTLTGDIDVERDILLIERISTCVPASSSYRGLLPAIISHIEDLFTDYQFEPGWNDMQVQP